MAKRPTKQPCPFCGSSGPQLQREPDPEPGQQFNIRCDNCYADGPWGDTPQEAWQLWDDRDDFTWREDELDGLYASLRGLIDWAFGRPDVKEIFDHPAWKEAREVMDEMPPDDDDNSPVESLGF